MGAFAVGQGRGGEKILININFGWRQRGMGKLGIFEHLVKMDALRGN